MKLLFLHLGAQLVASVDHVLVVGHSIDLDSNDFDDFDVFDLHHQFVSIRMVGTASKCKT